MKRKTTSCPCRGLQFRRFLHPLACALTMVLGLTAARPALSDTPWYGHFPEPAACRDPIAIVVADDGSKAYAAGRESDNVAVIDGATGTVTKYIAVGNQPVELALSPNGEILVVVNELSSFLTIVATATDQAIGQVRTLRYGQDVVIRRYVAAQPVGAPAPTDQELAVELMNPLTLEMYVTNKFTDEILYYDSFHGNAAVSAPTGWNPGPIAIDPEDRIWVSNLLQGTADVFTRITLAPITTGINLGAPPRALLPFAQFMLASLVSSDDAGDEELSEFGNLVGAIDRTTFQVTVVNLDTLAHPTPVAVPEGLAGTADNQILLTAIQGSNRLMAFLPASGTSLFYPTGRAPTGLAFHEPSLTAFTANRVGNSVTIVDLVSGATQDVAVGPAPDPNDDLDMGRIVFFDAAHSFPGALQLTCSSCHPAFHTDGRSRMEFGRPRQVLTSFNTGAGKTNPALSRGVISMEDLFGSPGISNPGPPLTAFVNSLEDPESPFANPDGTLTDSGRRGRDIYFGIDPSAPPLQCVNCHTPPFYSGNAVINFSPGNPDTVNVGTSVHVIPPGQGGGVFRDGVNIPSLLGIWDSQPYMSDGRHKTIDEVLGAVDYTKISRNDSGMIHGNDDNDPTYAPTLVNNLTSQQYQDLRTFLLSLSSQTLFDVPSAAGEPQTGPERPYLAQSAPNPFRTATIIRYRIERPGALRIRVFDAAGRLMRTLVDGPAGAGDYSVEWDGRDASGREVPTGVYFYRLESADTRTRLKIVRVGP